jgi:hypothetical protein
MEKIDEGTQISNSWFFPFIFSKLTFTKLGKIMAAESLLLIIH